VHTLFISPTGPWELDLHRLSGKTYLPLATEQPMRWHQRRPFVHGRQETKPQLDLGQRR
jgi:hypothetical protein